MHDPLIPLDIASDELTQRMESGFDVSGIGDELRDAPVEDVARIEAVYEALLHTTRRSDWSFEEPEGLSSIIESWPAPSVRDEPGRPVDPDRILGSRLGRIAGCNLGKPVEEGNIWTSARIRRVPGTRGQLPVAKLHPCVWIRCRSTSCLRENWPHTTLGRVDGSDRDDDIDYAILGLHLLEQNGRANHHPNRWPKAGWHSCRTRSVYTAERATYRQPPSRCSGVPYRSAQESVP